MTYTAAELLVLAFGATVCAVLVIAALGMVWHGPDSIHPDGRAAMISSVTFLLGNLMGYALRGRDKP